MKWSFASVGLIVLGLVGIVIILLFEQITTSNESDYYLLKEITEAAMLDSIDIPCYRETGDLKIVKEKFVENFTRRFAESTLLTGTGYKINFYEIMETPPKATVLINTGLGQYKIFEDTSSYNVQNVLSGILEYTGKNTNAPPSQNPYVVKSGDTGYKKIYYSMASGDDSYGIEPQPLNVPEELKRNNIRNIQIESITNEGVVTSQDELLFAKLNREIDWANVETNSTDYFTDIKSYVNDLTVDALDYYNCNIENETEMDLTYVDCDISDYWVSWEGTSRDTSPSKNNVALKLKITWKYEEYEYAD